MNLSGLNTFIFEGIQPKSWWEAERAKKYVRTAISFWVMLLLLLAALIYVLQKI
jgi:hypothetical protein